MSDEINDAAIAVIAAAVGKVSQQRAMASAIMRVGGDTLAKLSSHEDAATIHSQLAGRHTRAMARNKGGRR